MSTQSYATHVFALFLLFSTNAIVAAPASDAARGRALYEQHCGVCHDPRVHNRRQKLPLDRGELRGWVDTFRQQARLEWSRDEVEDVVEYLNQTYYRFPADARR